MTFDVDKDKSQNANVAKNILQSADVLECRVKDKPCEANVVEDELH